MTKKKSRSELIKLLNLSNSMAIADWKDVPELLNQLSKILQRHGLKLEQVDTGSDDWCIAVVPASFSAKRTLEKAYNAMVENELDDLNEGLKPFIVTEVSEERVVRNFRILATDEDDASEKFCNSDEAEFIDEEIVDNKDVWIENISEEQ